MLGFLLLDMILGKVSSVFIHPLSFIFAFKDEKAGQNAQHYLINTLCQYLKTSVCHEKLINIEKVF